MALLVGVVLCGLFVDFGSLVQRRLFAELPKIKESLGRSVRLGRVSLKLLPAVQLELRDLVLEAPPGQNGILAQPLIRVGRLRAVVALKPLLLSLGRKAEVAAFEIADVQVQIVRTADGRLSYQDVLDKLAKRPKSPPLTPEEIERLSGILIRHAVLRDAGVYFYDLAAPSSAPLRLNNIELSAQDMQLFAPFALTLDMAVLSAQPNFHLGVTLGPLPHDLASTQPLSLLRRLELTLKPVEIEPLLRFLPSSPGLQLGRAQLQAELALEMPAAAGRLRLVAAAAAHGLVLEDNRASPLLAARRGRPVDARLAVGLSSELFAGEVKVDELELSVDDMVISGQVDLSSLWTTPAVNKLALSSRGLLLERLATALPATALPGDAVLRGPLLLHAAAAGPPTAAKVELGLELSAATLILPALHKPEGTPASLSLHGQIKDQGADLERLELLLGPLLLSLSGKARSAQDLEFKLDSNAVTLGRFLPLFPNLERAVATSGSFDGTAQAHGTLKKEQDAVVLDTQVTLTDAALERRELGLQGRAEVATHFAGPALELERLLARALMPRHEGGGHGGKAFSLPRGLSLDGRVEVDSGRFHGSAVKDLLLEAKLAGKNLLVKTLHGQVFGGSLTAGGSSMDFGSGDGDSSRPHFSLRARLEHADLAKLTALQGGGFDKKLSGRGSVALLADGQGVTWAEIAPRLSGQLELGLTEARVQGASIGSQVIHPLLARITGARPEGPPRDLNIHNLSVKFRIEGGKLHTIAPVHVTTDDGMLSLDGNIGFTDKSLALIGNFDIAPRAIAAATFGRLMLDVPVPVGLHIGGSLGAPKIELVDIARTISALMSAMLR